MGCLVCERIEMIKKGINPYFVKELETGDTPTKGPVWWLPVEEMYNDDNRPTEEELNNMKQELKNEIERLLLLL